VAERCPVTSEALSAFVDGELPGEQRRELARHIVTCPSCSRQLGSVYSLKVLASGPDQQLARVPKGFWKRARTRLNEVAARAAHLPGVWLLWPVPVS